MIKAPNPFAFPVLPPCDMEGASAAGFPYPEPGMTLRDYTAIHSTQPGISEIAAMADVRWHNNRIWTDEQTPHVFDDWWETIPLDQRLLLCAMVRYAQADAMLAARMMSDD